MAQNNMLLQMNEAERHKVFGKNLDDNNLWIPMGHYIPIIRHTISTNTYWRGIPIDKHPLDSWVYQELIHDVQPTTIIEIGNQYGGSTVMLADWMRHVGGLVIGIDRDHSKLHPTAIQAEGIRWITGDARSDLVFEHCRSLIDGDRVLVIEDSMHTIENTYNLLKMYSSLVTVGSYYVVEDTDTEYTVFFIPSRERTLTAVEHFLTETDDFVVDRDVEKFFMTCNPKGFLRRVK